MRPLTYLLPGLLTLLSLVAAAPAAAQTVDPSFRGVVLGQPDINPNGYNYTAFTDDKLVVDAQGRILLAGTFDQVRGQRCGNLTRLLPDGTLDATFNPGGAGLNGDVSAVAALPNGQWLVGGRFTRYNGVPTGPLLRLHPDGTLDPTFAPALLPSPQIVQGLAVDSRGRVVVRAARLPFKTDDRGARDGLLRLLPNGARDASFQPDTSRWVGALVAVDSADRILVNRRLPWSPASGAYYPTAMTRLLPTGQTDPSFAFGDAGLANPVERVLLQPNGDLVVAGNGYFYYRGAFLARMLVRLHANGTLDTTFTLPTDYNYWGGLLASAPGGILTTRWRQDSSGFYSTQLIRLHPNGALDAAFVGPWTSRYWLTAAVTPTGATLVEGVPTTAQRSRSLLRLTATGAVDAAFADVRPTRFGSVSGLWRQRADRLLALGTFETVAGAPAPGIVRLLADGTPDARFQPDTALRRWLPWLIFPTSFTQASALVVDSQDRLLVNPNAMYGISGQSARIRRFLPDGSLDTTFYEGQGPSGGTAGIPPFGGRPYVAAIVPDARGRLLVGGDFTGYHGVNVPGVVRLLADGHVDPSFTARGIPYAVSHLHYRPDGAIQVVSGNRVLLLDSVGTRLDSTLLTASYAGLTFLPDGSWLGVGTPTTPTTKFTPAGIVDTTFHLDPALAGEAFTLVPQPNGGLLVCSELQASTSYPFEINRQQPLRRLRPDGSLDATFQSVELGAGRTESSYGPLLFQSTGDLIIGGSFTSVGADTQHPTLVRLTNIPTGLPPGASSAAATPLALFPNPARESLTLRRPTAQTATATLLDLLGRPVRQWPLTAAEQRVPLAGVPAGAYVVRVVSAEGVQTRRMVVE